MTLTLFYRTQPNSNHDPLNFIGNNKRNLESLLKGNGIVPLVTKTALKAFEDYQNAKLGFFHSVKKHTAATAAYGAGLSLPVGGVIAATYYCFKDYIQDPKKMDDLLALTPTKTMATIMAVAAFDRVAKKTFGVAPIVSVAKWTVGMMSSVLFYAAYQCGEAVKSSYAQDEQDKVRIRKDAHQTIVSQLETVYNDIADGFFKRYEDSCNRPKEMIKFKETAMELKKRFPYITAQLKKLDLTNGEISKIMDKLTAVVETIDTHALNLRTSPSDVDHRYNAELLAGLSEKELSETFVPQEVKEHIQNAKDNTLGIVYNISSKASALLKGMLPPLGFVLIDSTWKHAVQPYLNSQQWDPNACSLLTNPIDRLDHITKEPFIALGASFLTLSGLILAVHYFSASASQKKISDAKKIEETDLAVTKLLGIYDGISHFICQNGELKAAISAKLPTIKKEIAKLGLSDPSIITEGLESVLKESDISQYPFHSVDDVDYCA